MPSVSFAETDDGFDADAEPALITPGEAAATIADIVPSAMQPAPRERVAGVVSEANLKLTTTEFLVTGVPGRSAIARDTDMGFAIATTAGRLDVVPSDVSIDASRPVRVAGGDAVIVANTATDADTLTRPDGGGIETFTQIRSADAPEDFSWTAALPGQEQIRARADGGAEIVDAKGAVIATVSAPWAKDADGRSVPTTLSVSGDTLTMHVAHLDGGFAYPIVADPWWAPQWLKDAGSAIRSGIVSAARGIGSVVGYAASNRGACGSGAVGAAKRVKIKNPWAIAAAAAAGCLMGVYGNG
jgi:hypothetical protein